MANATSIVKKGAVRTGDDFSRRSVATLSSDTTYYTHAMIGEGTGGYLTKFDDTASLRFVGLVRGREGNPKIAAGTQGGASMFLDFEQPKAFELSIASVAITDIGRRVYALDDQTGTLDPSGTTYANLIGTVEDLVYATDLGTATSGIALVRPIYNAPKGQQLQVAAASGAVAIKASTVVITKSSAAALTIADPTTGTQDGLEMTFISATAAAHTLDNSAGSGFNAGGAATDVGTFGGSKGDGITIIAYAGKWYVKDKTNVTLG